MGMDAISVPEIQLEETRKLLKAAESLLVDIESNNAPYFGIYRNFNLSGGPCCAMGHIYSRAGFKEEDNVPHWAKNGFYSGKVTTANDKRDKPELIQSIKNLINAYKTKLEKFDK